MKKTLKLALLGLLLLLPSCELPFDTGGFGGIPGLEEPQLTAGALALVKAPAFWDLAAFYCPQVADSGLGRLGCLAALGPAPAKDGLGFRFRLPLEVRNPNAFPLPASELLTVLTLFPGQEDISLAAVCVSLCEDESGDCGGQGGGGCVAEEPELRGLQDLSEAALDYLSLALLSDASGQEIPRIGFRSFEANSKDTLNLTLDLGLDALQKTFKALFAGGLDKVLAGEDFKLAVPLDLDGTMWFVAENFGRFGAPFGPVSASFEAR
jgi:hypothetical protein